MRNPEVGRWADYLVLGLAVMVVLWLVFTCLGCAVPEGLQHQASGIQISPFGDAPQAPKITAGMYSFSLPDPPDSGPVINRTQIRGFGLDHNQTTTHGRIGKEFQDASGIPSDYQKVDTLPGTMRALHGQPQINQ